MGFFKRLFGGEGKIRFEGEAIDKNGDLRDFSAVMPFEGSLGTTTEKELINMCANHILVDKGSHVKKIRIVAASGESSSQCHLSGHWFTV